MEELLSRFNAFIGHDVQIHTMHGYGEFEGALKEVNDDYIVLREDRQRLYFRAHEHILDHVIMSASVFGISHEKNCATCILKNPHLNME